MSCECIVLLSWPHHPNFGISVYYYRITHMNSTKPKQTSWQYEKGRTCWDQYGKISSKLWLLQQGMGLSSEGIAHVSVLWIKQKKLFEFTALIEVVFCLILGRIKAVLAWTTEEQNCSWRSTSTFGSRCCFCLFVGGAWLSWGVKHQNSLQLVKHLWLVLCVNCVSR